MKNKINNQSFLQKLLIIFMIIQPILDIYYLYTDEIINIFKLSPATIIRMIFLCLLSILSYISLKKDNKKRWLIITTIVYALYMIFHHLSAISYDSGFEIYNKYSVVRELFYIIRMLMPLAMIFITKQADLKEDNVKKIIYTVINLFCITIIVTDLFEVSLTSYADGNKTIVANFLKWFNKDIYKEFGYELIASKGLFHMANQISATLLALLPIELYFFYKDKISPLSIITIVFNIMAMLIIGTRVASYGWLLAIILVTIEYLYFGLKKKYRIDMKKIIVLTIISVIFSLIIPYSPVANRTFASDIDAEIQNKIKNANGEIERKNLCKDDSNECRKQKYAYIEKYYDIYEFDEKYIIKNYPYQYDTDFWINAFDIPFVERGDHRQMQTLITKRVFDLNNHKNYFFGISFNRLRNIGVYIEKDIYVHLYTIGIVGILLFIMPYLFVAIYSLIKMLKNKNLTFINCIYLTSIGVIFLAGIVSGNVFDEWIVTLFLGLICGLLLNNILKENKNDKKKVLFISSTGGHLEELMQLKPMFNDYDYHIITERTKSNLSLTKKYPHRVNYLVYGSYTTLGKKIIYPFKLLYNTIKSLVLYLIIRPEYIISTGAHTAGPMCLIGHILGSKIIYIETFANSKTKSRTGSLVYKFADLFIVQWESMLELYPNAVYGGWIF